MNKSHTYQRNEFLGDAALGFMTSLSLFSEYPEWEEGQMSHANSAIVSNSVTFFFSKGFITVCSLFRNPERRGAGRTLLDSFFLFC